VTGKVQAVRHCALLSLRGAERPSGKPPLRPRPPKGTRSNPDDRPHGPLDCIVAALPGCVSPGWKRESVFAAGPLHYKTLWDNALEVSGSGCLSEYAFAGSRLCDRLMLSIEKVVRATEHPEKNCGPGADSG
jgi:hypothetical protein